MKVEACMSSDVGIASPIEMIREAARRMKEIGAVLSPVSKNEPILKSKVTGAGQRASLSALLDDGKRAVTVRVDDVKGVAGFVLPGDRVDVLLIRAVHQSCGAGGDIF